MTDALSTRKAMLYQCFVLLVLTIIDDPIPIMTGAGCDAGLICIKHVVRACFMLVMRHRCRVMH